MKKAALIIFTAVFARSLCGAAISQKTAVIDTQVPCLQQYFVYSPSLRQSSGLFVCALGYTIGEHPLHRAHRHDVEKLLKSDDTEHAGTMHAYHVERVDGPLIYALWLGESVGYADKVHLQVEDLSVYIYPLYKLSLVDRKLTFVRLTIPEFKSLTARFKNENTCLIS